ncbi:MAG: SDR family oxidoreductase [Bacteroidales bacterium]|jgi:NAD(P)-dependent dehydrogenase (short-subunit alcohol dehydrogenase family)|nr:SDR family oxidoreductase [Bacteroidales bacterium]
MEIKNILITGASRGIGQALFEKFSNAEGYFVCGIARSFSNEPDTFSEKTENRNCLRLGFDLSDFSEYPFLIKTISDFFPKGPILLVNNAGLLYYSAFENTTEDQFDETMKVNLKIPYFLIKKVLPLMDKNSHIVNVSSMGGFQGSQKYAGLSAYSASKGALAILTECLALELKPKGISVNCLCLGAVQTEMLTTAFPGYKAPVTPAEMASFIMDFGLNSHTVLNGVIVPLSLSNP